MPNGKPGDHPWTDFFIHNMDVFPPDISKMLRTIHAVSPDLIRHLDHPDMWEWEQGDKLDEARKKLGAIMKANGTSLDG